MNYSLDMDLTRLIIGFIIGFGLMIIAFALNSPSDTLLKKGAAYLNSRHYNDAIEQFSKAIEINPRNIKAYESRGEANLLRRDFHAAISDYSSMLRLDPHNACAYCGLATANENLGYYESALQGYSRSIELDPKYAIAYNNRAALKQRLGDASFVEDREKALELGFQHKWID